MAKPRISASGDRTVCIGGEQVERDQIDLIFRDSGGMIQKFLDEVETEGEWSLLFFNKKYSYAVLKRPKTGEFRTQIEHGGTFDLATPPRDYIEVAQSVVNSIKEPLLFARVDGVPVDGKFTLMELELIEPCLFLGVATSAVQEPRRRVRRFSQRLSLVARLNLGRCFPTLRRDDLKTASLA